MSTHFHRKQGFTLVEIMIVVVIVGMLASMALPAFNSIRISRQNAQFVHDLRTHKDAVEVCVMETGNPDQGSGSGTVAVELRAYVNVAKWAAPTPLGGLWDVEYNKSGIGLGVGVQAFTAPNSQLGDIDRKYDDSNIADGRLQLIAGDRYYWVIRKPLF